MKTVEEIEATQDVDARIIHASALLEYALVEHHGDAAQEASLGELVPTS